LLFRPVRKLSHDIVRTDDVGTRRGGAQQPEALSARRCDVKRWVAYRRQHGRDSRPLFVIEADSEREALCLASDMALELDGEGGRTAGAWSGPMVHVRLADEVPERDLAALVRRVAVAN
jgi:hypothetical protein